MADSAPYANATLPQMSRGDQFDYTITVTPTAFAPADVTNARLTLFGTTTVEIKYPIITGTVNGADIVFTVPISYADSLLCRVPGTAFQFDVFTADEQYMVAAGVIPVVNPRNVLPDPSI